MSRAPPGAPRAAALALPLLAVLLAGPGAAQPQRSLIDPGTARLQRDLRSLQNRSPSLGRDLDLSRARRDLLREGRGGYFTPDQARINRELERLRRAPRRPAPPDAGPTVLMEEELPRSYGEVDGLPSTTSQGLLTAERLVGRAEAALRDGRAGQARSDLATARGFLAGRAGDDAAARAALTARIDRLEATLAARGG